MAAVSNQNAAWKLAAMQKAERLTDLWDIIKAWAGRAAEIVLTVCMFISLVGMLPGVHYWTWVSNAVLAVQMIMLDFGGFALHTLAEHARDSGQDEAARQADSMANFLIGLVIATLAIITIGQLSALAGPFAGLVTNIVKYVEPVLILVRVVSSVKYIHVIHSLRGSTQLAIHPTQLPTQPIQSDRIEELEATIQVLNNRLTTVIEAVERSSSIQQPTQPTQGVEVSTHDLHTTVKPLKLNAVAAQNRLRLLTMAVQREIVEEDVQENEAACEADTEVAQADAVVSYPDVPGVSPEKVKQLINSFLSGVKWRDMPGNYSQTIKPVRDAWDSLHNDLHNLYKSV